MVHLLDEFLHVAAPGCCISDIGTVPAETPVIDKWHTGLIFALSQEMTKGIAVLLALLGSELHRTCLGET